MKFHQVLIGLCLLVFSINVSAQKVVEQVDGWFDTFDYEGGFKVLSPGELTQKVDSVETAIGLMAYHQFVYQENPENIENVVYMITYVDYPEGTITEDSTALLNDFFSATIESAAQSVGGMLVYSDPYEQQGHPGRVWKIHYLEGKAAIKTVAFVAGRRFFTIQTSTFRKNALDRDIDKFMESFRLIKDF